MTTGWPGFGGTPRIPVLAWASCKPRSVPQVSQDGHVAWVPVLKEHPVWPLAGKTSRHPPADRGQDKTQPKPTASIRYSFLFP